MKAIKIVGALLVLVVVSLIAVGVYVSTLDPNDYKGLISDKFTEKTGRTLAIDGDIRLTLYPWLGLEVNGVTVGNAPGFGDAPFLHADHAMARIKLMPLLNERYEIDTVRLQGAAINLAKNEAGQTNWADLASGEQQQSGQIPLAAIILGGVDIQNAALSWDDRSTGVRYDITGLTMTTGELVYGAPIELNLSMNAKANKPDLNAAVKLASTLVYDLDKETFDIAPFKLNTTLTGPNVPNRSATIDLDTTININMDAETLAVNNLQFNALGTSLTGTINATNINSSAPSYQTNLKVTGNDLSLLFKVAEIEPLATQIARLNNRSFDFSAAVTADMQRGDMDISGLQANLLGASISGDIKAAKIQSATPAARGTLKASGPDLPTLMQVMGQLQGGSDSPLSQYGSKLARVPDKSFVMNVEFDADIGSGDISLPVLAVKALGVDLGGKLTADNMQGNSGSIDGQFNMSAEKPRELLAALDQADLGEITQSVKMQATVKGNRNDMNVNPFDLTLVLAGAKIPNSPVNLALNAATRVNLDKETLNLESFKLSGLGLNLNGRVNASGILQKPAFDGEVIVSEFSLRKFMQQLNQELPVTADSKVFEKVSLTSSFAGSAENLDIKQLALVLDETNLNGTVSVANFAQPSVQFGITIDQINADRYLPPPTEGQNRPVTPETAAGAATQLPVETLRSLNAKGDMKIGQLVISKAKMSDIALTLDAANGKINLAPVSANLYQGRYEGNISLDATADVPVVSFNSSLTGVQVDPLMTDFSGASNVSGVGNIELAVTSQGADTGALKRTLNGNGKIALEQGVLRGVDVASVLEQVEIMIESKIPREINRGEQTAFDTFSATMQINNGVVSSNDLSIKAPGLQVSGQGTVIDLNNDTLNYHLVASADAASATRGEERYNIGGYSVPIRCQGQVNSPSCLPDVGEIIKAVAQRAVQQKIGNVLQKAMGIDPAQQQQQQPATDQTTDPSQQQQPSQPVSPEQELINKALKSIFK